MAKSWTHRKACRLCNSRAVIPVLKFAFTPPESFTPDASPEAEKIPLIISLCEKCRGVQSLDVVNPEILFADAPCPLNSSPTSFYQDLARDIVERGKLQKGELVVDIGCGNAELAGHLQDLGMKVIGIDPSLTSARIAGEKGITHFREYFTPALANRVMREHGPASAMVATFTLGMVDNLHIVFSGIRHLLKPGGLFHFVEPAIETLVADGRIDLVHHGRISFFGMQSLEPFLRSVLMHAIDCRMAPLLGGSLHVVVQRSDGARVAAPSVRARIDQESGSGWFTVEYLNQMAGRVEKRKADAQRFVSDGGSQGRKVAGYGLHAGTVTLLTECGWNKEALCGVISDDNGQAGRTVPGTDIPVLSWAEAERMGVSHLLLLGDPWLMGCDPARIEAFRKRGGAVGNLV